MASLDGVVSELFRMPGGVDAGVGIAALLRQAAQAHRTLLVRAADDVTRSRSSVAPLLLGIRALLRRGGSCDVHDRFLLDPTFVEGLHAAADDSPALSDWHRHVTSEPGAHPADPAGDQHLGNSLLELLLRDDPHWQGKVPLQTDLAGRLRFPLCHWSIALWSSAGGPAAALANQCVTCSLARHDVRFALRSRPHDVLLAIPRRECLRLFVNDDDGPDADQIRCARGPVGLKLQFAGEIPGWHVRFDPVGCGDIERHAGLTGGIALAVLNAIALSAPGIAAEFDACVASVRGCDVAPTAAGTVQSFSDPSLPGVMGINVTYNRRDEPLLCPFCFTWFGHELGHTKSYLIETILHVLGHSLTVQHGRFTETIPEYGRALAVRTLLQIPYTHLYEWLLLIQFLEAGFAHLPWTITADPLGFGEGIHSEIEQAFERIARDVPLAPAGRAAVARLHSLYGQVLARWQRARRAASHTPRSRTLFGNALFEAPASSQSI